MAMQFSTSNVGVEYFEVFFALSSKIKDETIDPTAHADWQLLADTNGDPSAKICRAGAYETASLKRTQGETFTSTGGKELTLQKVINFEGVDCNVTADQLAAYDALINQDVRIFLVPRDAIDNDDGSGSFLLSTGIAYCDGMATFPEVDITAGQKRMISLKATSNKNVSATGIVLGAIS